MTVAEELAALRHEHGATHEVWTVPKALGGGPTWHALRPGDPAGRTLHAATPLELSAAIRKANAEAALDDALSCLRGQYTNAGWRFGTVWASASTTGERRLTASRNGILLTAADLTEMHAKIRHETSQAGHPTPPRAARGHARPGDHVAMRHDHQQYPGGELVLVIDCSDLARSAAFWCAALGYQQEGPPVGQYLGLFPPNGAGLQLLLQRTDDPKPAKNRLHLDLRTRELGPEVTRIQAAGGVLLTAEPMAEFGFRWQILADPDGNELCVVEPPAEYWLE